jgi:hypothetical protein
MVSSICYTTGTREWALIRIEMGFRGRHSLAEPCKRDRQPGSKRLIEEEQGIDGFPQISVRNARELEASWKNIERISPKCFIRSLTINRHKPRRNSHTTFAESERLPGSTLTTLRRPSFPCVKCPSIIEPARSISRRLVRSRPHRKSHSNRELGAPSRGWSLVNFAGTLLLLLILSSFGDLVALLGAPSSKCHHHHRRTM